MSGLISKLGMTRLMHLFAGTVLFLVMICAIIILNSSGKIADDIHNKDTLLLAENELSQQIATVAKDQSQISNWDATLVALEDDVDKNFVRREIANWLWVDFKIQSTIIIGPDGKPRVAVLKNKSIDPELGQGLIDQHSDLIEAANKLYFKYRKKTNRGYSFPYDPTRNDSIAYASDFRIVEDKLGIVMAQAIVPSEGYALPEGNPHIMLVFKPFSQNMIQQISEKLDFNALKLTQDLSNFSNDQGKLQVGTSKYWLIWDQIKPSTTIWEKSIPILVFILLMLGGSLMLFSIRYGRLLSELQKSEAANRFSALHDALTGLPNRAQFDQVLTQAQMQASSSAHAILAIDLDYFKEVNDTYGHQAGDIVLTTAAARIKKCLDGKGMVARMGGDEFIALLHNASNEEATLELCKDIIHSVSEEIILDEGIAKIGASIGAAHWPDFKITAHHMIRNADQALYEAKKKGRGCVCFAEDLSVTELTIKSEAA